MKPKRPNNPAEAAAAAGSAQPGRPPLHVGEPAALGNAKPAEAKPTDAKPEPARFRCPKCEAILRGRADLTGKAVRCPRCSHRWVAIVVPPDLSEDNLPVLKDPLARAAAATAAAAEVVRAAVLATAAKAAVPHAAEKFTGLNRLDLLKPAPGSKSGKSPVTAVSGPPKVPAAANSATPARVPTPPLPSPASSTNMARVPKRLGQFELIRLIGKGGMGLIFEARDTVLSRPAAVKLLRTDTSDDKRSLERFLREARAAARVEHPNIMPIWQVGLHDSQLFIAMPLIRGGSCADWLRKKGPMSEPQATWIISESARGLAAAHAAGVIHRDIKPSNLLLDENGSVRVADFGLAKATDDSIAGQTREGQVIGTAHYMSPEQARGKPVDPRSDFYALGATYYHLLVGKPPFLGTNTIEVLKAHLHSPIPDPRELRPELPLACTRVIRRMMAKRPEERFQTADDLIAALGDIGLPDSAPIALTESRSSTGDEAFPDAGDSQPPPVARAGDAGGTPALDRRSGTHRALGGGHGRSAARSVSRPKSPSRSGEAAPESSEPAGESGGLRLPEGRSGWLWALIALLGLIAAGAAAWALLTGRLTPMRSLGPLSQIVTRSPRPSGQPMLSAPGPAPRPCSQRGDPPSCGCNWLYQPFAEP